MDNLFEQMKGFLKMEDELPFAEFNQYYLDLMALLQKDYQELKEEGLLKACAVCGILASNSQSRSLKKDVNRKKFIKMTEKSKFWEEAIKARLVKEGIPAAELDEKISAVWGDEETSSENQRDN